LAAVALRLEIAPVGVAKTDGIIVRREKRDKEMKNSIISRFQNISAVEQINYRNQPSSQTISCGIRIYIQVKLGPH
jgi:hypothetical protein